MITLQTTYAITLNILNLVILFYSLKLLTSSLNERLVPPTVVNRKKLHIMVSLGLFIVSAFALVRSVWSYWVLGYFFEDSLNQMALFDRTAFLAAILFLNILWSKGRQKNMY